ncbi:MAG: DUF2949 domain-containing protein [Nostoc sp. TH1S01]|nr:DUF2949 domain-containing protein [Nostoc sp. TH1S01]
MSTRTKELKFINFLHTELELTNADIAVALRHKKFDDAPLPMLLWQYGLVNLEQLEQILDWLDDQR